MNLISNFTFFELNRSRGVAADMMKMNAVRRRTHRQVIADREEKERKEREVEEKLAMLEKMQ